MENFEFKNIVIIGFGLMGGSLAKSIRKYQIAEKITAYNHNQDALDYGLDTQLIDIAANSISEIPKDADLAIICTPIDSYDSIFSELEQHLSDSCLITDIGSVKKYVIDSAEQNLINKLPNFVAAHPIAGSDKTGANNSIDDLYFDKKLIITPSNKTNNDSFQRISAFWKQCGSHIEIMTAEKHDQIMASISHFPQFISFCYGATVKSIISKSTDFDAHFKSNIDDDFKKFFRLTMSDARMWSNIFIHNQKPIDNLAISFLDKLQEIASDDNTSFEKSLNNLPIIIASITDQITSYHEFAGSGFRDLTSPIFWQNNKSPSSIKLNSECFIILDNIVRKLRVAVKHSDKDAINQIIDDSRTTLQDK